MCGDIEIQAFNFHLIYYHLIMYHKFTGRYLSTFNLRIENA
jgi:hypothetical protein